MYSENCWKWHKNGSKYKIFIEWLKYREIHTKLQQLCSTKYYENRLNRREIIFLWNSEKITKKIWNIHKTFNFLLELLMWIWNLIKYKFCA